MTMSEHSSVDNPFQIHRIYTKDISFETPNTPLIFEQPWKPEIKIEICTTSNELESGLHEVVLQLTITARLEGSVAFLCQVHQAGLFSTQGVPEEVLISCLGAYCPTILFPYARECVSSLVARGSFPQLDIAPVNFDLMLAEQLQRDASALHNGQGSSQ